MDDEHACPAWLEALPEPVVETFQRVVTTWPLPLALATRTEIQGAHNHQQAAGELIRLCDMSLHYAAMVAACDYLRYQETVPEISLEFYRLRRPLVSVWANLLRVCVPALAKENALFVPELEETLSVLTQGKATLLKSGVSGLEQVEMPLIDFLQSQRNSPTHNKFKGNWKAWVETHITSICDFLHAVEPLMCYPLMRWVNDAEYLHLKGCGPAFDSIQPTALPSQTQNTTKEGLSPLFLKHPEREDYLSLDPFIVHAECPYCLDEQTPFPWMNEEVFLFNGQEGKKFALYYGARHARPLTSPKARIESAFDAKYVLPRTLALKSLSWAEFVARTHRLAHIRIGENTASQKYIQAVYHPNMEMEEHLKHFLTSDRSGLLLLAEAGMGKTCLLCRQAERWSDPAGSQQEAVLFYSGHALAAHADALGANWLADLQVNDSLEDLQAWLVAQGRRLIIIIDGVNENARSPELLKSLAAIARRFAGGENGSGIKLVISCRSTLFDHMLKYLGDEKAAFPLTAFHTTLDKTQVPPSSTYRVHLHRIEDADVKGMYENYQAYEGRAENGQTSGFHPLSRFADLSVQVRALIRHPWMMRLVTEVFNGREVPEILWPSELLEEYCRLKIFGKTEDQATDYQDRRALAESLVAEMDQQSTDHFQREDLFEISRQWSQVLNEYEVFRSPYLQLVEECVLTEISRIELEGRFKRVQSTVRFAFEALFEFLLSERVLRVCGGWENIDAHAITQLVDQTDELYARAGAAEHLLTEAAIRGRWDLIEATLCDTESPFRLGILTRTIYNLRDFRHPNFEALVKHVSQSGDALASLMLFGAATSFQERHDPSATLTCVTELKESCPTFDADGGMATHLSVLHGEALRSLGRNQEATDLMSQTALRLESRDSSLAENGETAELLPTILITKGSALSNQGQMAEAMAAYQESVDLLKQRIKQDPSPGASRDLAWAYLSMSGTLQLTGSLNDALRAITSALQILHALVIDQKQESYADDLASAFSSKANCLGRMGELSQALAVRDDAVQLLEELIMQKGLTFLAGALAFAYMHKGIDLKNMRKIEEAVEAYDAAETIMRRLSRRQQAERVDALATCLMNKGNALQLLNRLDEARTVQQESVAIYEDLVHKDGHQDLSGFLGKAQLNFATALMRLEELPQAREALSQAEQVLKDFLQTSENEEVRNDLCMTHFNLGVVHKGLRDESPALKHLNQAIQAWEKMKFADQGFILPNIIRAISYRVQVYCELNQYEKSAHDLDELFNKCTDPLAPETVRQEFFMNAARIADMAPDKKEKLYEALGPRAFMIKSVVDHVDRSTKPK